METQNTIFEGKINNIEDLVKFLLHYFHHVKKQSTAKTIHDYIKTQHLKTTQYPISMRNIAMTCTSRDYFEKKGMESRKSNGRYYYYNVYGLTTDPNQQYKYEWTGKIHSKKRLRKFIDWYLHAIKGRATVLDMINYIHDNDLIARNYEINPLKISMNAKSMPETFDTGEKAAFHGDKGHSKHTVWALRSEQQAADFYNEMQVAPIVKEQVI